MIKFTEEKRMGWNVDYRMYTYDWDRELVKFDGRQENGSIASEKEVKIEYLLAWIINDSFKFTEISTRGLSSDTVIKALLGLVFK